MGWLLLIGAGLWLFAGGGLPSSSTSLFRETLLEPPDASHPTAKFLIELTSDGETWWWVLYGQAEAGSFKRPELGKGDAASREQAVQEAYDLIKEQKIKLPTPLNRHGVRMAADCRAITVQSLDAWIDWGRDAIDKGAQQLGAGGKKFTAGELMRWVFGRAFPECKDATPKIRGRAWANVVKSVQKIVDKAHTGDFLDVNPLGVVLAARMVAMSPPKKAGRAFWYTPQNQPDEKWAIIVDQAEDGWRFRIWTETAWKSDQGPIHGDIAAKESDAAANAKKWVDFYNP